ncbi:MAG TPA: S41 family peptidase, partial [Vicinamibacteria bacterium]|nr:S41 family peptidase [Vicinamibacteria bacterium]
PVPKMPLRNYVGLQAGKAGELYLHEAPAVAPAEAEEDSGPLHRYVLADRKSEKLADDVADVHVSADGTKLLVRMGKTWAIADATKPVPAGGGEGKLKTDTIELRVDPRAEWRQMYREAWRLQRDFFYDPGFHGLDLAATEKKYEPYLLGLAHRDELNELFVEALGNLSVGHLYVSGGDLPKAPEVKGGLLGADWEIANGRYRIARILGAEVWNPELEAPLARPGVGAKAGEYLVQVEGRDVRPPASVHSFFEGTAGTAVRIRLAADPEGKSGVRDVTVVPVADERRLRYRAWAEDNRRAVEKLSKGRLGYVHLPNTGQSGYQSFNRYFFSQLDREGLVVDERNNGGGLVADYMVDVLGRRTPRLWVATREGMDFPSPAGALYGPKVMLIDRHAGSGGDALPWMFREMKLGPIIGTRTWGGLVGIWDYPPLADGGRVTAPRGALFGPRGKWEIENIGVSPDIEIEVMPADFASGRDPQLEKAVEVLMAELARNPRPKPRRPEYPDYQVTPWRSEAKQ